jgi:hypothetical protein
MSYLHSRRARFALRAIAAVVLTLPLAGAECADLTSPGAAASTGASYDGIYTLASFDGKSGTGGKIFDVDAKNYLQLTRAEWEISNKGKHLETRTWTTQVVNGVSTSAKQFNPEIHTCEIAISGGKASCTLDSGTSIQATIGSNTVTTTNGSHVLVFKK